VLLIV